jgi:hypothetical protein
MAKPKEKIQKTAIMAGGQPGIIETSDAKWSGG